MGMRIKRQFHDTDSYGFILNHMDSIMKLSFVYRV